MAFIQKHMGCPSGGKELGCWGPIGEYYTLLGSEVRHLGAHLFVSVVLGVILFGILLLLKRKAKINLKFHWLAIISAASIVVLFLLLAYLFPVRILY